MSFQLHIWGPAFSLPSIDPQCLAAVAYFKLAVPVGEWELVASCDPTLSPTRELPALRDGSTWIGGFWNIIDYIDKKFEGLWSLERGDAKEYADTVAFASFIEAHVQPLLDLSLYVSSENYTTTTRPAYSSFLKWPSPWLIPSKHRAAAKARTEYLGLSSLDVDSAHERDKKDSKANPYLEQIPRSFRVPRQSVSYLLQQSHHASRFRLDALTDNAMGPLQELLGEKYFVMPGNRPMSLDCLMWAHLALALLPKLPQPWLAESMRARYPSLCTYVHTLKKEVFVEVHKTRENHGPPLEVFEQTGWSMTRNLLFDAALRTIPKVKKSNGISQPRSENASSRRNRPESPISWSNVFVPAITAAAAIAALGAYLIHSSLLDAAPPVNRSLSDYGDAGAMLAMVDFGDGDQNVNALQNNSVGPVGVDVSMDDNIIR